MDARQKDTQKEEEGEEEGHSSVMIAPMETGTRRRMGRIEKVADVAGCSWMWLDVAGCGWMWLLIVDVVLISIVPVSGATSRSVLCKFRLIDKKRGDWARRRRGRNYRYRCQWFSTHKILMTAFGFCVLCLCVSFE